MVSRATPARLRRVVEIFGRCDLEGRGEILISDLARLLRSLDPASLSKADVDALLSRARQGGLERNGYAVRYEDFVHWLAQGSTLLPDAVQHPLEELPAHGVSGENQHASGHEEPQAAEGQAKQAAEQSRPRAQETAQAQATGPVSGEPAEEAALRQGPVAEALVPAPATEEPAEAAMREEPGVVEASVPAWVPAEPAEGAAGPEERVMPQGEPQAPKTARVSTGEPAEEAAKPEEPGAATRAAEEAPAAAERRSGGGGSARSRGRRGQDTLSNLKPEKRVRAILTSGALRLVDARWLLSQSDDYILQRRQDLPPDAFLSEREAAKLLGQYHGLVVISYGWLHSQHPDPLGFHMRRVRSYLQKHLAMVSEPPWSLANVGVFWDYACLPQNHPDGTEKTEDEQATLDKALGAISHLYGAACTTVVQLTHMPTEAFQSAGGGVCNLSPYSSRGWCFFEATVSGILKDPDAILDLGLAAEELEREGTSWSQVQEKAMGVMQPPLTPEDMEEELAVRKFTNGDDLDIVMKKYEQFFKEATATADALQFSNRSEGAGWRDGELGQLARALPAFRACEALSLKGHAALGEPGLATLRAQLPKMRALDYLCLPAHLEQTSEGQAVQNDWLRARKPAPGPRVGVHWV